MNLKEIIVLYYNIVLVTIASLIVIIVLKHTIFKRKKYKDIDKEVLKLYQSYNKGKGFLMGTMIAVLLYFIVGYLIFKKYVFFAIVLSGSMSPTINKYDLVLIQTIDKEPRVGDIILYRGKPQDPEGRELILHRVIKISGDNIYTKGDANPNIDPWVVHREEIVGKAVTLFNIPIKIPYIGKYFVEGMENPRGITYFQRIIKYIRVHGMSLFLLIAIIYIIFSYYEERKRKIVEEKLKRIFYEKG